MHEMVIKELSQIDILKNMYSKHLMTASTIAVDLEKNTKSVSGCLMPEDLYKYDQDHFCGIEAIQECIDILQINSSDFVLDVGSGFGGPARFISKNTGSFVRGIEIQNDRYLSALSLTKKVGLDLNVSFINGDINQVDIVSDSFSIAISFLAILRVIDKRKALRIISNAINKGGKIFIEDYYCDKTLDGFDQDRLLKIISCPNLLTKNEYLNELSANGIEILSVVDMTEKWNKLVNSRYNNIDINISDFISIYGKNKAINALGFASGVKDIFADGIVSGFRVIGKKLI